MSRTRRATSRIAAACAAATVLAWLGAPAPAGAQDEQDEQDEQAVSVDLGYTCELPAGPAAVRLGVTAVFPPAGTVGHPVQPADPALRLSVPPAALADLPEAFAVTAVLRLTTVIAHGGEETPGSWSGAQAAPAELPAEGDLVLEAPSEVAPVTVEFPGELTFAARELSVELTGYRADGTVAEPPTTALTCAADPGQDTTLAAVPVSAEGAPPSSTTPPAPDEPGGITVDEPPTGRAPRAEIPPECRRIPDLPPEFTTPFCAQLLGYTNVAKLKAAAYQPPGIQNIMASRLYPACPEDPAVACQRARTLPNYQGEPKLPPAPNAFLPFGFVPSEATMQLTQEGVGVVYLWSTRVRPYVGLTTANVRLTARISDVTVAGVPLDVGPDCRTVTPIEAELTANYESYSITLGGLLQGTVTIPAFTGCGVDEDLDPLLTGMISGPGNYVRMTQGRVCPFEGNQVGCPPVVPAPRR